MKEKVQSKLLISKIEVIDQVRVFMKLGFEHVVDKWVLKGKLNKDYLNFFYKKKLHTMYDVT